MSYKNKKDENKNKREYYANHREYFKERIRRNQKQQKLLQKKNKMIRRQFLKDYKLLKGCSICGYNNCAAALEFHHVKGDKNFVIGNSMSRTIDSMNIEIDKCIVVCANCHRELHEKLRQVI